VYVGTASGLYRGTPGGAFERASLATGELRDDWVTALAVRGAEVLVGTYSGGITKLTFTPRPRATHLGGGYVNPGGLTIDGTQLLASTMEGLFARPLDDDRATGQLVPRAATGRDVTGAARVGGALWVASRRGIAIGR